MAMFKREKNFLTIMMIFAAVSLGGVTLSLRTRLYGELYAALPLVFVGSVTAIFSSKRMPDSYAALNRQKGRCSASKDVCVCCNEVRSTIKDIISFCEMSLDSGKIRGACENLEKVFNSGVTLSNIIDDILEAAIGGNDRFLPAYSDYGTPGKGISLNVQFIRDDRVKFNLQINVPFPMLFDGDAKKIRQIFNSILSNSFTYVAESSANWELHWGTGDIDHALIRETLNIGTTESRHNECSFSYIRELTDEAGLGLLITKNTVETMNGRMAVEMYRGSSVFTARFRQTRAGQETIGKEIAFNLATFNRASEERGTPCMPERKLIPRANVLIVDQLETDLELIKDMLRPYGMRIDCVDDGCSAAELIAAEDLKYDVIFIDYSMPVIDGFEAVDLIRGIATDYAESVPIIAVSSDKRIGEDRTFTAKGFQDFVAKPIDAIELNGIINRWVR